MKQVHDHQYVDGLIAAAYVVLIVVAVIAHHAYKRWCDKHEKKPEPKVAYTKQLSDRLSKKVANRTGQRAHRRGKRR